MVFPGERTVGGENEAAEEEDMERLMPLHNFDFPCLKWGEQKLLRCVKVDSDGDVSAVDRKQSPESGGGGGSLLGTRRRRCRFGDLQNMETFSSSDKTKTRAGDGEIEATRAKLMFDFQTEIGKMKDAIMREGFVDSSATKAARPSSTPADRPWNLRTRRAPSNFQQPNLLPARNESKSTSGEESQRTELSVSLTRRELEEDFMAMAGRRPPRRPKKRPRIVQKQLDTLFPGLWLTQITADLYRVPDAIETEKR